MASKVSRLLRSFVNQIQDVENAGSSFFTAFNINTAVNAQLDVIGEWLGEPRLGLSDDDYRDVLYLKIATNRATGCAELIIETLLYVTDTAWVELTEDYPAKINVQTNASGISPSAESRIRGIIAAGVGFRLVNAYDIPFVFDTDDSTYPSPTPPDFGLGFDELAYYESGQHIGGKISELIA